MFLKSRRASHINFSVEIVTQIKLGTVTFFSCKKPFSRKEVAVRKAKKKKKIEKTAYLQSKSILLTSVFLKFLIDNFFKFVPVKASTKLVWPEGISFSDKCCTIPYFLERENMICGSSVSFASNPPPAIIRKPIIFWWFRGA